MFAPTDSLWDSQWVLLQWGAVIGASLAAAAYDAAIRKIPNFLTGTVFLTGLVWAVFAGRLEGLADGVVGCLLMAVPFVLLFVFAGGGAGDAKMMGALGTWLGTRNGVVALVTVVVTGALLGVGFALARKRSRLLLENLAQMARAVLFLAAGKLRPAETREMMPETAKMQAMPYGVAIFLGVCVAAAVTAWWRG